MPSNKIIVTIIICLAIVTSVWVISKNPSTNTYGLANSAESPSVSARAHIEENANDEWKRILSTVPAGSESYIDLTKRAITPEETTLTAQMSKDLLSQYLILKKSGVEIGEDEINQITSNLLSSPTYSNASGALYVASNLKISNNTDRESVKKYRDAVNGILKNSSSKISTGPVSLVNTALSTENAGAISKLHEITLIAKGMIDELLRVTVPKDATKLHLNLLNTSSNMLFSLESMEQAVSDPVKGLSGITRYNQNMLDFQTSLSELNAYFINRTGSAY